MIRGLGRSRLRSCIALALALLALPATAEPPAQLIGTLRLTHPAPWFGGFSGIEMAPRGDAALMISDRGRWVRAMLERDASGALTGVTRWTSARITGADGRPLPRERTDSEGLARIPGGGICISYEGATPRVDCHDDIRAPGRTLPGFAGFDGLGRNSSLEALAADGLGRLYTMPEKMAEREGPIPVFRWSGTAWSVALRLPDQGRFRPVGADILDDQLYVLLRAFGPLGFSAKLIRLPLSAQSGDTAEVLLRSGPGSHDNLEGLSVWRNPRGEIVASMVSDDNMNWFQRSEIVEYRLPDPPAPRDAAAGPGPVAPLAVAPLASAPLASLPRSQ